MAVTTDILRTYRAPRQVMRRLMDANAADNRPEARGFVYLLVGCLVIYLSQVPEIVARGDGPEGAAPRDARLAITFFAWLFLWPLLFYILGGLSHVLARLAGGQGTGADARLALFWTVLAISPLFLLRELAIMAGTPQLQVIISALVALAFFTIWGMTLLEAERPTERQAE